MASEASTSYSTLRCRLRKDSPVVRCMYIRETAGDAGGAGSKGRRLYVAGIPAALHEAALLDFFGRFGEVERIALHASGLSAIVEFAESSGRRMALRRAAKGEVLDVNLQAPAGACGLKGMQRRRTFRCLVCSARATYPILSEPNSHTFHHARCLQAGSRRRSRRTQATRLSSKSWTSGPRPLRRKRLPSGRPRWRPWRAMAGRWCAAAAGRTWLPARARPWPAFQERQPRRSSGARIARPLTTFTSFSSAKRRPRVRGWAWDVHSVALKDFQRRANGSRGACIGGHFVLTWCFPSCRPSQLARQV